MEELINLQLLTTGQYGDNNGADIGLQSLI